MILAKAFSFAALIWSSLVGVLYFGIWIEDTGALGFLIVGSIGFGFACMGMYGAMSKRLGWTWASAGLLSLWIFAPALSGIAFVPAAISMVIAAILQSVFDRPSPSETHTNGAPA